MTRKRATPTASKPAAGARAQAGDSFANFAARVGVGTDNQSANSSYQFDFISRNRVKLEAMYRGSWLVGQAVDVVAEDMTRAGVEVIGDDVDPNDKERLYRSLQRLGVWDKIADTIKWGRLYGGAIGVLLIDGQNMATPLRRETVGKGQFKGIYVLDRWMCQPSLTEKVTEFGPHFGEPLNYTVLTTQSPLDGKVIHYSRVVRIDGVDLPYQQRFSEQGWGQSVIERLYDRLVAFDSTTQGAAQLVYKAHLRTLQVEGLREILAAGGPAERALLRNVEFIRRFQSNEGLTLLDAKDKLETSQYTFAGLDNVLLQFGQQLSGALQIPLVRLFGQSPVGLNATGESDMEMYRDGIKQQQERRLRSPFDTIIDVTWRSELGSEPPEDLAHEFRSLAQMSDTEKATVANTVADAVTKAFDLQAIDRATAMKELRASSHATGIFSNITDEMIEEAENDPPPQIGESDNAGVGQQPIDGNAPSEMDGPSSIALDADWDESKHPRAKNGEFGRGSGNAGGGKQEKLTANEKSALSSYSGDDFLRINKELRDGNDSDPMVARIDSAIEKSSLPEGSAVYRGMTKEAAKQLFPGGNITRGGIISDPAFASTSKSPGEAKMRAIGGVLLKIEAGPNAKGLDMQKHSRNVQEQEILLPRNAQMKVVGLLPPKSPGDPVIVRVTYGE